MSSDTNPTVQGNEDESAGASSLNLDDSALASINVNIYHICLPFLIGNYSDFHIIFRLIWGAAVKI